MAKSVLQTISEYAQDAEARERLATADLELELCDRMVFLREQAGFTQKQLADSLGYSQAYIAKLENGGYDKCGLGTLRPFVRALGYEINIDQFFTPIYALSRSQSFIEACLSAEAARLGETAEGAHEKKSRGKGSKAANLRAARRAA